MRRSAYFASSILYLSMLMALFAEPATAQTMYAGDSLKFWEVRYSNNGNYKINWSCSTFYCFVHHYEKVGSAWNFRGLITDISIWFGKTDNPAGLYMQSDGNLVAYDEDWVARWESDTHGTGATYLNIQDDGNVVLYDINNNSWWTPRCLDNGWQTQYPPPSAGCP